MTLGGLYQVMDAELSFCLVLAIKIFVVVVFVAFTTVSGLFVYGTVAVSVCWPLKGT